MSPRVDSSAQAPEEVIAAPSACAQPLQSPGRHVLLRSVPGASSSSITLSSLMQCIRDV
jgi:hypothetical protein